MLKKIFFTILLVHTMIVPGIRIEKATLQHDLPAMVNVINKAYKRQIFVRDDKGRIDKDELKVIIEDPKSTLFVAVNEENNSICGTICLKQLEKTYCEIGLISVDPHQKGNGIGSALIAYAENKAHHILNAREMRLYVMPFTQEGLVTYYQKLGYCLIDTYKYLTDEDKQRYFKQEYWDNLYMQMMVKTF